MVGLTNKNRETNYCEFTYDEWETDKDSLPTLDTPGKENLSTIKSCSVGSIAVGGDGTMKRLNGNTNSWEDF